MLQGAETSTTTGRVNTDLAGMDAAALSKVIEDCHRETARLEGRRLRAIAALDQEWAHGEVADFVTSELVMALRVTEAQASSLLALARTLTRRLPATFTALEVGDIDGYKARVIAEYTDILDDAAAAVVENAVLGAAAEQSSTQLKRTLNREILKADPVAARKRRERAEKHRQVRTDPQPDGMANLYAYLTAEGAAMVILVLDGLARAARSQPGETRTLDELRADMLVAIFRAILETGGYLAGYGYIPAHVARTIAKDATWTRLVTDPVGGQLLDHGTTWYRPGKVLENHVIARDQTCRFAHCTTPAEYCEIDHTIPYPHGPTADHNTGALSKHHHRAKHAGFHCHQPTPGTFVWRSPTGRTAIVGPAQIGIPNPVAVAAAGVPARLPNRATMTEDEWLAAVDAEAERLETAGRLARQQDVLDYSAEHGPPDDIDVA